MTSRASRSTEWMEEAKCRDASSDVFFKEHAGDQRNAYTRAKELCEVCPVRSECLEWALADRSSIDFGVFGGTTPRERRKILASRRQSAA